MESWLKSPLSSKNSPVDGESSKLNPIHEGDEENAFVESNCSAKLNTISELNDDCGNSISKDNIDEIDRNTDLPKNIKVNNSKESNKNNSL